MSDNANPVDGLFVKLGVNFDALKQGMAQATETVSKSLEGMSKGLEEWGINTEKMGEEGEALFKKFGVDIDAMAGKLGMSAPALVGWAALGVAIYEVGEKIFEIGKEYDEAFSNIGKATGATGQELRALGDDLTAVMGSGVEQNLQDVAGGFAILKQKLDVTGDTLRDMTVNFAQFADVNRTTVTAAVESVSTVMNKWNIDVKDSPALLDQLTKAAQMSGVSTANLTESLTHGAAQFQALGLSLTDATGLMAAFGKDGVNTQMVMTGLRTAVQQFTKDGADMSTALTDVFEKIKNAKDPTEALTLATSTFGAKAGVEMANAIRSGKASIEGFTEAIAASEGTLKETGEGTASFGDKAAELGNKVQAALAPLGEVLIGIGKGIIDSLTLVFNEINDVLGPVITWIQQAFRSISDIVAAAFGLVKALVHGDWNKVWLEAQLIVAQMVKAVLDFVSGMVNTATGLINSMLEGMNVVLDKVGLKIPQIAKLSLSAVTGLDAEIKKLYDGINAKGEESSVKLGAAAKVTSDTSKKIAEADAAYLQKLREDAETDEIKRLTNEMNAKIKQADTDLKTDKAKADAKVVLETEYQAKIAKVQKDAADKKKAEQDKLDAENQKEIDAQTKAMKKYWDDQVKEAKKGLDAKTQAAEDAWATQYQIDAELDQLDENSVQAEILRHAEATAERAKQMADLAAIEQKFIDVGMQGFEDMLSGPFMALGKALVEQKNVWAAMGNAAIKAIGAVIKAMGDQLAQLAAADLVQAIAMAFIPGAQGAAAGHAIAAGIETAGAAAAYTAAGALSAVPAFATGTINAPAGVALVGEAGPELVTMKGGETVTDAGKTASLLSGQNNSPTLHLTINSPKQLNLAEAARVATQTARKMAWSVG